VAKFVPAAATACSIVTSAVLDTMFTAVVLLRRVSVSPGMY